MWNESLTLEEITELCQHKIDQLLDPFYCEHPHLEEMWPGEVVEDALIFCGFGVVDEPLPRHQLALCDMSQKLVVVNSQMGLFVHKWTNLKVLRRVTLAHELGHAVLHWSEICQRVYRSYLHDDHFVDSRAIQKENEADLFGRLFLVPTADLLHQKETRQIQIAFDERCDLGPREVASLIKRLASRFRVNPATMKSRLADLGWLYPTYRGQAWNKDLRLRKKADKN